LFKIAAIENKGCCENATDLANLQKISKSKIKRGPGLLNVYEEWERK